METLRGKTALVTGSAKRLGKEIVLALAKEGIDIIIHYNSSKEEAERTAAEISDVRVKLVKADLETEAESLAKITDFDFLINNASIYPTSSLESLKQNELEQNFRIHSFAPLLLAKSFLKKKRSGAIINIIDCKIDTHHNSHLAYHLSKKSLRDVTLFLAKELAPNVRVNAVAPGLVIPPEKSDPAYAQGVIEINPLKRIPTANEITNTVLFFLKNPSITGQIINVDGGRSLNG